MSNQQQHSVLWDQKAALERAQEALRADRVALDQQERSIAHELKSVQARLNPLAAQEREATRASLALRKARTRERVKRIAVWLALTCFVGIVALNAAIRRRADEPSHPCAAPL
jgi:peptidoglycan hydrolase CwlO-like protein